MDDNERYDYAYSVIGKKFHSSRPGHKKKRISMIACLADKSLFAPFMFEGHCDSKLFEYYVEEIVIKVLEPNQVLIIDNASFHKPQRIKVLVESVGCKVLFLPSYSPDLNPIEKYWFKLKTKIKKWMRNKKESLSRSMEQVLKHLSVC
jgi:putative transposase